MGAEESYRSGPLVKCRGYGGGLVGGVVDEKGDDVKGMRVIAEVNDIEVVLL